MMVHLEVQNKNCKSNPFKLVILTLILIRPDNQLDDISIRITNITNIQSIISVISMVMNKKACAGLCHCYPIFRCVGINSSIIVQDRGFILRCGRVGETVK